MSLKKRLIATAAVIAMAAAAMYGSTLEMRSEAEVEQYSLLGDKETIYFWYADETLTNYLNSAAVTFGEREDVRVIPVLTSESEYLEAINDASLHTDQIPDAYLLTNDLLGKAYLAGLAGPILDETGVCTEQTFPKAALSAVTYRNQKIAYPLFYETGLLVYNETYLEEWARQQVAKETEEEATDEEAGPTEDMDTEDSGSENATEEDVESGEEMQGLTYEEYLEQAVPTTVDGILQFADSFDVPAEVEGVFKWDVSDILYNYWFVGNYMSLGGENGDAPDQVNLYNEETIDCLSAYKNMNQFFSIESDTVNYESVIEDFINGKTVFTIATTDIAKRLEEAKKDGSFAYEYGIAILPDVSDTLKSRSMSVTSSVVINGYSTHKELANRFAQYLTTEAAWDLYERSGKVPAAYSTVTDGPLQIMMMEYEDSVPLPKMLETENYWMHLEVLFSKIWNGADVAAVLQELDDQMRIQLTK